MGKLVEAFKAELVRAGFVVLPDDVRNKKFLASTVGLPENVRDGIVDHYRGLGGAAAYTNFTSGKWDIATGDGLLIEFDEQLHFNRYRHRTLASPWSAEIPWTVAYLHYSSIHEDECVKAGSYGQKWTSPSTEKMFGPADPPRTFDPNGSPRWKQRALYDAVKDAYAVHTPGISMTRVSLYDHIGGAGIHQALKPSGARLDPAALREFVTENTIR
ncbi:hypothetical protein J2X01_000352 [Arthrobacter ginsengisoli]|uniref:Uncharacterized protein n=1 Tax=Arthrobacter ginsengisoli TaxID=1356565 RepID=A0ABU1U7B8_9MICC|nr:hypothetical protein [Arthrobacter ginsengisoli]MDR7081083.1 hypothetical protein [Arthrobacter ginsengisoli]